MSEGMNRVTLIGNLGQDPELRHTQGGEPVLGLRMATTESYVDRNKERQERTEWHSVTVWGRRGEALSKFLSKGTKICVEGRLQTRSWEKNGDKRYSTEVVANNIILLGGGDRRSGDSGFANREQGSGGGGFGDDGSEIPF